MKLPEQNPKWKPKFIMASAVFVTASLALFTDHLTGGEWVTASILILGVFTTGSVAENKAVLASK